MDRSWVKVLLVAWDQPAFKAGLQHVIDLDEVTSLLAALAADDHEDQVGMRALDLLRSALDTAQIRHAALLLIEADDTRDALAAGIADALADRPELARTIRSALDDATVRAEIRAALESPSLREALWRTADDAYRDRRWAVVRHATILLLRHRHARRLLWALKRHGVLRELRHRPVAG